MDSRVPERQVTHRLELQTSRRIR